MQAEKDFCQLQSASGSIGKLSYSLFPLQLSYLYNFRALIWLISDITKIMKINHYSFYNTASRQPGPEAGGMERQADQNVKQTRNHLTYG